jgi:hypothetical protein
MTQEAMKQALEFFESGNFVYPTKIATDLRQAIREHAMYEVQRLGQEIEQEPVAILNHAHGVHTFRNVNLKGLPDGEYLVYTRPPQRTWVGLTDEEILAEDVLRYYFGLNGGAGPVSKSGRKIVDAIEAKLKEKNT